MPSAEAIGRDRSWRGWLIAGAVVASLWLAAWLCQFRPGLLWSGQGFQHARQIAAGFFPPAFQMDFVSRVFRLLIESIAIGTLGLACSLLLALPLAWLAAQWPALPEPPVAARGAWLRRGVRWGARGLLAFCRSIPALIWAFLFVRMFGLGPAPAVFAIALSFGGIIGKLYAELLEACDPAPVHALQAAGASRWAIFWFGLFPQVRTQWLGYGLFRLECSIRRATVLGIVGAGGIGAEVALSLRYFQFDKLATALLAILAAVILFEALSAILRRLSISWSLALLGFGVVASVAFLAIPWGDWLLASTWKQAMLFARDGWGLNLGITFLGRASWLLLQTLMMAWLATWMAGLAAFLCAPFAARSLWLTALVDPPARKAWRRWLSRAVLLLARLSFQVTRAIPTLVWALLFVVWVGPGPMAGVLAIAVHTFGLLGRLYGETYEEAELQPLQRLEASGAGLFGRWLVGLLPQTLPRLIAYTFFRLEVNIRMTAVVGFVGAGGIGDAIHTAISLFHFRDLMTLLVLLFVTVVGLDMISGLVRRRWLLYAD